MTERTPEPVPSCLICHRHRDTWGVCDPCIARTDSQLRELLDLHALAATVAALEPGRTADPGPIGRGSKHPPLPLNLAALDLAVGEWLLRSVTEDAGPSWAGLELWEIDWRHHFGLRPYGVASEQRTMPLERDTAARRATETPGLVSDTTPQNSAALRSAQRVSTLAGVIAFLHAWWPRAAAEHPAADEFATDVRRMHSHALAALGLDHARPWTVPCPADLGDRECGYRLHVDYAGHELVLHCPRCDSDWTVERLLLVAAAAGRGVWVTVAEAAEQIGVHRATIYRAVQAGNVSARYGRVDLVSVRAWNEARIGA